MMMLFVMLLLILMIFFDVLCLPRYRACIHLMYSVRYRHGSRVHVRQQSLRPVRTWRHHASVGFKSSTVSFVFFFFFFFRLLSRTNCENVCHCVANRLTPRSIVALHREFVVSGIAYLIALTRILKSYCRFSVVWVSCLWFRYLHVVDVVYDM
jgi:hypothetical protein